MHWKTSLGWICSASSLCSSYRNSITILAMLSIHIWDRVKFGWLQPNINPQFWFVVDGLLAQTADWLSTVGIIRRLEDVMLLKGLSWHRNERTCFFLVLIWSMVNETIMPYMSYRRTWNFELDTWTLPWTWACHLIFINNKSCHIYLRAWWSSIFSVNYVRSMKIKASNEHAISLKIWIYFRGHKLISMGISVSHQIVKICSSSIFLL